MSPDAFALRCYEDADHDGVVALWQRVFPGAPKRNDPARDIRRKLREDRSLFFVAVSGARVVGTTMAGFDGHRGWLHLVAIHPDMQGRGVGEALVEHAAQALTERGCPKINLQVRSDNDQVVGFYRKLGFEVEERISMGRVLGDGSHESDESDAASEPDGAD